MKSTHTQQTNTNLMRCKVQRCKGSEGSGRTTALALGAEPGWLENSKTAWAFGCTSWLLSQRDTREKSSGLNASAASQWSTLTWLLPVHPGPSICYTKTCVLLISSRHARKIVRLTTLPPAAPEIKELMHKRSVRKIVAPGCSWTQGAFNNTKNFYQAEELI